MRGDWLRFPQFALLTFSLGGFTTTKGAFVPALFVLRLRDDRIHWQSAAMPVHGHECEIGGRDLLARTGNVILDRNPDPYFHRGLEYPIHRGLQQDHVAYMHRNQKVDVVD